MSYNQKNSIKTFSNILAVLLMVVFVLCGVGLVVKLPDIVGGLNTNFSVSYGSSTYSNVNVKNKIDLHAGYYSCFDVSYKKAGSNTTEFANNYFVNIVPSNNDISKFDFFVNSNKYNFTDEFDLTDGFDIILKDNSFMVYIPSDFSMANVLQRVYSGHAVVGVPEVTVSDTAVFTLVVFSFDKSKKLMFDFTIMG